MITPVIIGPVVLPEPPNPTTSECQIMLAYADELILSLESVAYKLEAASSSPDQGLVLIRNHIYTMISDAGTLRNKLNSIHSAAKEKANLVHSKSQMY